MLFLVRHGRLWSSESLFCHGLQASLPMGDGLGPYAQAILAALLIVLAIQLGIQGLQISVLLLQVDGNPVLDEGSHVRGAFLAAEVARRLLGDDGGYLAAAPGGGGGIQQGAYEVCLLREGRIEEYLHCS